MFNPLDIVHIKSINGKYEAVTILERHINLDDTITYITTWNCNKEYKEEDLILVKRGCWREKVFKIEFYPGDRVSWIDGRYLHVDTIVKKIYSYETSRALYKMSCGITIRKSHLRLCEGGI